MAARGDLRQMSGEVLSLLEPELIRDGFEILDVRVFQGGGRVQVRIYVDLYPDGGITLDECTRAGRTVNMLMEEADIFAGQYVLEVSSPGIRRPLRLPRHFQAAVGQKVDLKLSIRAGRGRVRGVLTSFEGQQLRVQPPVASGEDSRGGTEDGAALNEDPAVNETIAVHLEDIQEANLDPEFDAKALINADRRRKKDERRQERQSRKKTKKSRPRADRMAKDDSSSHDES